MKAYQHNEMTDLELLASLSDFLGSPVFYQGQWVLGYGEGHYGAGTGSEMGLDGKPLKASSPDDDVLLFLGLVRESMPSVIGTALVRDWAVKVVTIDGRKLTAAVFGLTKQEAYVSLELTSEYRWEVII